MRSTFLVALLSAASVVVALPTPVDGSPDLVVRDVEVEARAPDFDALAPDVEARADTPAVTTKKKGKKKGQNKIKPEVVPVAIKPEPKKQATTIKWTPQNHPKENVPKNFGKKGTGKN